MKNYILTMVFFMLPSLSFAQNLPTDPNNMQQLNQDDWQKQQQEIAKKHTDRMKKMQEHHALQQKLQQAYANEMQLLQEKQRIEYTEHMKSQQQEMAGARDKFEKTYRPALELLQKEQQAIFKKHQDFIQKMQQEKEKIQPKPIR
ncbi:MAG: hypothetical protein DRQ51_09450 [Gammaproteobacteria bacterium]|nr:MAG: hypothetical protein DRQ51_09450 [Gammaproteobacteria bacterium]